MPKRLTLQEKADRLFNGQDLEKVASIAKNIMVFYLSQRYNRDEDFCELFRDLKEMSLALPHDIKVTTYPPHDYLNLSNFLRHEERN